MKKRHRYLEKVTCMKTAYSYQDTTKFPLCKSIIIMTHELHANNLGKTINRLPNPYSCLYFSLSVLILPKVIRVNNYR